MMELDHLAVSGETLAEAQAYVEDALGVSMQQGGAHDVFHTHNTLMGLDDGLYLEAIAIDPSAPCPTRPRWFGLDDFNGQARLTNWICRTEDLEAQLAILPNGIGAPVSLRRGDLRWRMVVPETGHLPFDNLCAALIQWDSAPHPAQRLKPTGCRLRRLTLRHPDGADLAAAMQAAITDDRVAIETGSIAMEAMFETPHGARAL